MEGAAGGGDLPEVLARARTHSTAAVGRAMIASHADAGAPANVYPTAPWWGALFLFEQSLRLPFAIGGAGHGARAPTTAPPSKGSVIT
jgi:hypothetical protein